MTEVTTGFATLIPTLHRDAVLRVGRDGDNTLVVIANASDGAFVTCFPEGSGAFLDHLLTSWTASNDPPWRRLTRSIRAAADHFLTTFVAERDSPDWDTVHPSASVFAVQRTPGHAVCAWVGAHQARLHRDGRVIRQTMMEDVATMLGVDEKVGPTVPTRLIALDGVHLEPNVVHWPLRPGDQLQVLSFPAAHWTRGRDWTRGRADLDDAAAERLLADHGLLDVAAACWIEPPRG